MSGVWRRIADRFAGRDVPAEWPGRLAEDERVLVTVSLREGGHLVATSLGLWVPDGEASRRIGWHLISKASWGEGALAVIEAEEAGSVEDAVLLADRPARRFRPVAPATLPEIVHKRVTGSILSRHHRDLPGGGAWFVQRKVSGQDGVLLQVRPDPGTEPSTLRPIVAQVALEIRRVRQD